jgi:RHS repeat-associated protein
LKQVDYGYDQGVNGTGRLSSITETSAAGAVLQTTAYAYDQHGRTLSEARAIGGVTYTTGYAYDAAGRMRAVTYPSGRTLAYGLDGLGRVSRIETTGGGVTQVVVQDVLYHPFGAAKSFTFGNLLANSRSFDLDGRIASHSLAGQTKTLSFDAASRITRIAQQGVPANFADYGYDALDRLTSTVLATSTFSFGYDAVGNRTSKSTGVSTELYSYPATSNRLAQIAGSTTTAYTHDPNGSITGAGANAFGYDARGRLVSSSTAGGAASFQVNALGQRVRKTSAVADTVYHYDLQGRLIGESSAAGVPIREYIWLGDQPVGVVGAGQAGAQCPANPTLDTSNTFTAFNNLERLEVRSGRLGAADWEWGLGNNTQQAGQFTTAGLDWVNNKVYGFTLVYNGAGSATITVTDGSATLFTRTWATGMDAGNALKLYVKSSAGIDAGNLIRLEVTSIDGQAVADSLQTSGDGNFSEVGRVYAGTSPANGFTVEGTVALTFTGSYPPTGSRLNMMVTAGNVQCQGGGQQASTLQYVHADHLNTPRVVTNQTQQVVWRWENTEPFGNSAPEENPSGLGNFEFPLRFPGQYRDAETGLFYNYFRDYDPQTGRYVQSDPIGLAGGINPYLYVDGNPVSFADPQGLNPLLGLLLRLFGIGATATSVANDPVPIVGRGIGGAASAAGSRTASSLANELCSNVTHYGPLTQGPLASSIANTFRSGTYSGGTLTQAQTMYRVTGPGGNPAGSYWTTVLPTGPVASTIDSALLPQWGNTATQVVTARIPAGTQVYMGVAAPQGGLVGGGVQVYIPQASPAWITGVR